MAAVGRNRRAFDATLRALRDAGRVEAVDEALIVACRSLSDAVDGEPSNASLWRQYREALCDLREVGRGDDDDGLSALVDQLRSVPAKVRDSED